MVWCTLGSAGVLFRTEVSFRSVVTCLLAVDLFRSVAGGDLFRSVTVRLARYLHQASGP